MQFEDAGTSGSSDLFPSFLHEYSVVPWNVGEYAVYHAESCARVDEIETVDAVVDVDGSYLADYVRRIFDPEDIFSFEGHLDF